MKGVNRNKVYEQAAFPTPSEMHWVAASLATVRRIDSSVLVQPHRSNRFVAEAEDCGQSAALS